MSDTNVPMFFLYDFATGETIHRELTKQEIEELPQAQNDLAH